MSKFGHFEQIVVKMRSKAPLLNLGYGVLVTSNFELFEKMINLRFISLPDSKVEMKEYSEPKVASCIKLMESLKYHITLDGAVLGMCESDIRSAIYRNCGKLSISNIVIKKAHD
jgi:hypothetical protein